jgi:hypothetical protein
MKYLKKFNEQEKSIEEWCREFRITNYEIIGDTVDVSGEVSISFKTIENLPIKFGKVGNRFYCSNNRLTTLDGCPKKVNGNFSCSDNMLTTLIGGPIEINGYYHCSNNKLISLEGSPEKVVLGLGCYGNPIFQIYKLFGRYERYQASLDYNYFRNGNNIIKKRFEKACFEAGISVPKYIRGYKYIKI